MQLKLSGSVSLRHKAWALSAALITLLALPAEAQEITVARRRAYELFKAVTGVPVPIDDARIVQMEQLLAQGNDSAAVKIATGDKFFYDIRLRDIARPMSNRAESMAAPVNDFVAMFVGVARDDRDARELLTGSFYYKADPTKTMNAQGVQQVRANIGLDIIISNNHYEDLWLKGYSLYDTLMRVDGAVTGNRVRANGQPDTVAIMPIPDPAGLITTRAFLGAHADAGTNRRLVEHSFRQFMCVPMEAWMDASRPDNMVGRDVDRFPGGTNAKYQVTCKACHTQMDAFKPAFAYVDWNGESSTFATTPRAKVNRNQQIFPEGFVINNTNWLNYAQSAKNVDQFGWRSPASGSGINSFGQLLANSAGFSRCMTKRLFTAICKRAPSVSEDPVIRRIASDFEQDYKLKRLAETVATNPLCLPKQ